MLCNTSWLKKKLLVLLGIDFNDLLYTHIARVYMCVGVCMHVCVCEGGSLTVPCTTVLETVVVTCACGHRVYNWELGLNNILLFFFSFSQPRCCF